MDLRDCIKFANENPICFLATTEDDQPRVRALGYWFADKTGFYFKTARVKDFCQQLKKNPKTEVCFYKNDALIGTMLRIAGTVEFIEDEQSKDALVKDRPFLKEFEDTIESPDIIIFRMVNGQAYFWSMENNLKTKEYIYF